MVAPEMSEKQREVLVGAGKEIGQTWLQNAVKNSKDAEQMMNQVFCLQVAAAHLLATCAFNCEMQQDKDGDEFIDGLAKEMKRDLEEMRKADDNGEMELIKAGKLDA